MRPLIGLHVSLIIFSGLVLDISSISIPPAEDAITTIFSDCLSTSMEKYNSFSMVETDTGFTIFLGGLGNFNFFGRHGGKQMDRGYFLRTKTSPQPSSGETNGHINPLNQIH